MPVLKEELALVNGKRIKEVRTAEAIDGTIITLEAGEKVLIDVSMTVVCDGPRCKGGLNGNEKDATTPTTYRWTQGDVQKDPNALPDGTYRMLVVQAGLAGTDQKVFCSSRCVSDWFLNGYVPAMSPREKAEQDKRNMEAAAKNSGIQVVKPAEQAAPPAVAEMPSVAVEAVGPAETSPEDGA